MRVRRSGSSGLFCGSAGRLGPPWRIRRFGNRECRPACAAVRARRWRPRRICGRRCARLQSSKPWKWRASSSHRGSAARPARALSAAVRAEVVSIAGSLAVLNAAKIIRGKRGGHGVGDLEEIRDGCSAGLRQFSVRAGTGIVGFRRVMNARFISAWPSMSRLPLVTTCSPSLRPDRTSTSVSPRRPVFTGVRS